MPAIMQKDAIPTDVVENIVQLAMIGLVRILGSERITFDDLIGRVATKGGITEEGVKVLRERLPSVFDALFTATLAKRELLKQRIADENNA